MGLIVGVNSYFDITEANEIVKKLLPSFDDDRKFWEGIKDDADKEAIILRAMAKIDNAEIPYKGEKLHADISLQFPRMDYDELIECPEDIKKAIILQAIRDSKDKGSEIGAMKEAGVHSLSDGGGASITFESGKTDKRKDGIFSDIWRDYIKEYIDLVRPLW